MKIKNIINCCWLIAAGIVALTTITSCEKNFYDEEQYRKEVYIVSGDENIFGQEYAFGKESVGYISIYVGGTTPIEEDVDVELELYPQALRSYNQRIYGENYASYVQQLAPENYVIENWRVTISKDNPKPYVMLPIKVNVSNLIDGEEYYIPLRIKSVSNYMISPTRRVVLFRIYVKNDYATSKSNSYYNMAGLEQIYSESNGVFTPDAPGTGMNSTKLLKPSGETSVRMMPGSLVSANEVDERNKNIVLTVHPDEIVDVPVLNEGIPTGQYLKRQKVTVASWDYSSSSVVVADVEGEQSYYDPETQTFTINYRYRLSTEKKWHFMYEVLSPLKQ